MPWMAFAVVVGTTLAAYAHPTSWVLAGLLAAVLSLAWRRLLLVALVALGGGWRFLDAVEDYASLASTFAGSRSFVGRVVDLPSSRSESLRFRLAVLRAGGQGVRGELELFWFRPDHPLVPGDLVLVEARVRPPRGLANPGGFDAEAWAFARGIHGRGHVQALVRVARARDPASRLDRLRLRIADQLIETGAGAAGRLLPALAVGDRRALSDADREVLVATGTMHLLAISGLHVGLVAALGMLAGALAWRMAPFCGSRRGFALASGILPAALYAALAGFSTPTVRALCMLVGMAAGWWSRGRVSWLQGFAWSAACLVLWDPGAVADAGYWLSFGAVAVLALACSGWLDRRKLPMLVRAQAALLVGLRPVAGAFGLPGSWLAPLVNFPAIPWVGWLVVPPLLLGLALGVLWDDAGAGLLAFAGATVNLFMASAGAVASPTLLWAPPSAPAPWVVAGLALGAGALMLPRALPVAIPALVLLLGAGAPGRNAAAPKGALELHVFDVGHGLALLLSVGERWLLYDAGGVSRSGWSAGSAVLAPFLQRSGIGTLDRVVLSHGDDDHAGGWPALRAAGIGTRDLVVGDPALPGRRCIAGESWRWGPARFTILHPSAGLPYLGNDSSCVLLVQLHGKRVLLPGDASSAVEARLARTIRRLDLLVAGHHGSASSTSRLFVDRTRPSWVVFSNGYANRFRMPRPEVVGRVGQARLVSTAACGYLRLRIDGDGVRLLAAERDRRRRPWHPRSQDDGNENQYDCRPSGPG